MYSRPIMSTVHVHPSMHAAVCVCACICVCACVCMHMYIYYIGSLRAGCLPWRWKLVGIPISELVDRVCALCDEGCVEDEIHFITTCRALHNEKYTDLFCNLATVDYEFLLLNNYYEKHYVHKLKCVHYCQRYITYTNYGCHYCISSRITLIVSSFLLLSLSHYYYYYHYVISSQFFFICRVTHKPKYGWAIILCVT